MHILVHEINKTSPFPPFLRNNVLKSLQYVKHNPIKCKISGREMLTFPALICQNLV